MEIKRSSLKDILVIAKCDNASVVEFPHQIVKFSTVIKL
jgi:hypothetical protein